MSDLHRAPDRDPTARERPVDGAAVLGLSRKSEQRSDLAPDLAG